MGRHLMVDHQSLLLAIETCVGVSGPWRGAHLIICHCGETALTIVRCLRAAPGCRPAEVFPGGWKEQWGCTFLLGQVFPREEITHYRGYEASRTIRSIDRHSARRSSARSVPQYTSISCRSRIATSTAVRSPISKPSDGARLSFSQII